MEKAGIRGDPKVAIMIRQNFLAGIGGKIFLWKELHSISGGVDGKFIKAGVLASKVKGAIIHGSDPGPIVEVFLTDKRQGAVDHHFFDKVKISHAVGIAVQNQYLSVGFLEELVVFIWIGQ